MSLAMPPQARVQFLIILIFILHFTEQPTLNTPAASPEPAHQQVSLPPSDYTAAEGQ
jgi:hypothetical protein